MVFNDSWSSNCPSHREIPFVMVRFLCSDIKIDPPQLGHALLTFLAEQGAMQLRP